MNMVNLIFFVLPLILFSFFTPAGFAVGLIWCLCWSIWALATKHFNNKAIVLFISAFWFLLSGLFFLMIALGAAGKEI